MAAPAFTTTPVTSVATRRTPTRTPARSARTAAAAPARPLVLGAGQSRRVRVSTRRIVRRAASSPSPSPSPSPRATPRPDAPVPAPAPAIATPPADATLVEAPTAKPAATPAEKSVAKPGADAERREQRRARAQKAYLDEQLAQRQAANAARKARPSRAAKATTAAKAPQKRVRAASRQRLQFADPSVLKDTFQAYMDEISREELLDQSEVIALALQIRRGVAVEDAQRSMERALGRRPSVPELAERLKLQPQDVQTHRLAGTAAKNTLVAANLRLVTSVARKVASSKGSNTAGLALDDMVQEGSVGLIRAAEKYDATRGYKFSTYATWWIRAFVMRSITTQSRTIKLPTTIIEEYARIRKEYSRLNANGNFKPSDEVVAKALGVTPAKLRFVLNVVTRVPTSLDIKLCPKSEGQSTRSLGEIVEGEDNLEERMVEEFQRKELDLALQKCLKPMERATIRLRFGLDDGQPRTLREVGDALGLSKERIRQLIFRALPKMKTPEIQRMLLDATTR